MNEESIYLSGEDKRRYLDYKKRYEPTSSNLECEATITSLEEFQRFLKETIGERITDCVFRGEEDYENNKGKLTPYIFRPNYKSINEKSLINGVVNEKIDEFSNMKNTLDILIKMQHYRIPTRLLDISFNPYKALFFALGDKYADGYFYVINTTDKVISEVKDSEKDKNPSTLKRKTIDSDTVAIVSSMSLLNENPSLELKEIFTFYNISKIIIYNILSVEALVELGHEDETVNFEFEEGGTKLTTTTHFSEILEDYGAFTEFEFDEFVEYHEKLEEIFFKSEELYNKDILSKYYINDFVYFEELKNISESLLKVLADESEDIFEMIGVEMSDGIDWLELNSLKSKATNYLNILRDACCINNKAINDLIHEVKNYKPGFLNRVLIEDLFEDYLILPRNNNQRVINQEGGFILKGLTTDNEDSSVCVSQQVFRIKIPHKYKHNILKDLEIYHGISTSYIYPELDYYNFEKFKR